MRKESRFSVALLGWLGPMVGAAINVCAMLAMLQRTVGLMRAQQWVWPFLAGPMGDGGAGL